MSGQIPTYRWRCVPEGLATRRQLRKAGLRPGGQPVVAQIRWRSRKSRTPRFAFLYREELALPVRPMTPGKVAALAAANRARRICPDCRRDVGYVIPRQYGCCIPCSGSYDQAA